VRKTAPIPVAITAPSGFAGKLIIWIGHNFFCFVFSHFKIDYYIHIGVENLCALFFGSIKLLLAFISEAEVKTEDTAEAGGMDVDVTEAAPAASEVKVETSVEQLSPDKRAQQSTIEKLTQILSGTKSIYFHLQVKNLYQSITEVITVSLEFICEKTYYHDAISVLEDINIRQNFQFIILVMVFKIHLFLFFSSS